MEEKAFSSEPVEEVIDLLDIVPAEEAQEEDEVIELSADYLEKSADSAEDEDAVLELTELVEPLPAPSAEKAAEEAPAVPAEEHEPVQTPDAYAPSSDCVDEESFLRLTAELEARIVSLEEARLADAQAAEQKLAALAEQRAAEMAGVVQDLSSFEAKLAEAAHAFETRLASLEQKHAEDVQALEARVTALEERLDALEVRAENSRQELEERLSHIFEESSLRLPLEEMVGTVVEARLASSSEGQDAEETPDEKTSIQAVIETVDELTSHVDGIEKRVAEWEERCEQEAALAAARVIREEIAAMRAGAARMAR